MTSQNVCYAGIKEYFIKNYPGRDDLLCDPKSDEVNTCREFIRKHTAPYRRGHTSYHFKHEVEIFSGRYIANGSFIMAAILENVEMIPRVNSPNCMIFLKYTGGK